MFYAGQKVECIKSVEWTDIGNFFPLIGPKKGDVLTVSEVFYDLGQEALRFQERFLSSKGTNIGYLSQYFRPLTESKKGTEIGMAILRKICETGKLPGKKKVDA